MISNVITPTQYAARFRMPEDTVVSLGQALRLEDAGRQVHGTRVSTGITLVARPHVFGVAGVRSWSPPV